jgi:hypothetical protein
MGIKGRASAEGQGTNELGLSANRFASSSSTFHAAFNNVSSKPATLRA